MRTRVYEITDEDVLDAFFDEDQPDRPLLGLMDHGELIFDGNMSLLPDIYDTFLLNGPANTKLEYGIIARLYHADEDVAVLYVSPRIFGARLVD